MGLRERISRAFGGTTASPANPQAAFFQNEQSPYLVGWNPQLREMSQDVQASWQKSAARAVSAVQNSGFLAGIVEVSSGGVVGSGLRMASRPDVAALEWKADFATKWARDVESRFRAYAEDPKQIDAAGQMNLKQMQQAAYASYMVFGEILALMPMFRRGGLNSLTKVSLIPPTRLSQYTDGFHRWTQGVRTDGWGFPVAYRLREPDSQWVWRERDVPAANRNGRPNILHFKEPGIAVTRGISPLAPVLKVTRQVDQYADATLTSALIQTIFAATIKSSINGLAAFDGLMTNEDQGSLDLEAFSKVKGEWYNGAKIDLTQHGRIAHLMPNDELEFTEAKQPGQQFDHFMGWLHREIARGAGVTYESATGDYRGATYSSVRMAGAVEWLTVLRRRENLIVPFCKAVFEAWLDEQIGTGRIEYPGGYEKFKTERQFANRSSWTGPARPQADDFKTARAYEVRKDMQATTLAEIHEEYGRDWDDDMRQRAAENALADELGLPLPWSPKDLLETEKGLDAELNAPANSPGERPDKRSRPRREGAGRNPPSDEPTRSKADELESELQASLDVEDPDVELERDVNRTDHAANKSAEKDE